MVHMKIPLTTTNTESDPLYAMKKSRFSTRLSDGCAHIAKHISQCAA